MGKRWLACLLFLALLSGRASGFDDSSTHRELTRQAILNSNISFYLGAALGFPRGIDTFIGNIPISESIIEGSRLEDQPMCRASNHFHNPLRDWSESGLRDQPWFVNRYCSSGQYPPNNIKSAVHWGTSYPEPQGPGIPKVETGNQWNWDRARASYYTYLTGMNLEGEQVALTEAHKRSYLASSFQALGQVLHLLQDMAVPAHVRDDFRSHLEWNGITSSTLFSPAGWVIEKFEDFVQREGVMNRVPVRPNFQNPNLTSFWDTNEYRGQDPDSMDLQTVGLAEYTNMNFASKNTIFTEDSDPASDVYYHPYPRKGSVDLDNYVNYEMLPQTVIAEDNLPDTRFYIAKTHDGEVIHRFLAPTYFTRDMQMEPGSDTRIFLKTLKIDDECARNYAEKLLPRAIGYSAALLDYFFRGVIEISLPETGAYAILQDADPSSGKGFTRVSLLAGNVTDEGEEMTDGSIELVVKYKLALADPFRNYYEPVPTTEEFFYILAPEAKGVRVIPRDGAVKLDFDLEDNPIPLWATDVYLQVVYRGRLGLEDGAVAVGFKDIFEPTPMDIINNMDKVCINGTWLDAGSAEAIAAVDRDEPGEAGHGIADPDEWDVYPHDLKNLYLGFFPVSDCRYPSCTDEDLKIAYIEAGDYVRVFLLTDERYCMSHCAVSIVHTHPDDRLGYNYFGPKASSFPGLKNQTETETEPGVCGQCGLEAPCEIRYFPAFSFLKGVDRWNRYFFDNAPYPSGSSCSYDQLP